MAFFLMRVQIWSIYMSIINEDDYKDPLPENSSTMWVANHKPLSTLNCESDRQTICERYENEVGEMR